MSPIGGGLLPSTDRVPQAIPADRPAGGDTLASFTVGLIDRIIYAPRAPLFCPADSANPGGHVNNGGGHDSLR